MIKAHKHRGKWRVRLGNAAREYPNRESAERYAQKINELRHTSDGRLFTMVSPERFDLLVALEAVGGDTKLLKELAFQALRRQTIQDTVKISKAGWEFIVDAQRRNCRERTWLEMKKLLSALGRGEELVSAVTEADCHAFVDRYQTPTMRMTMQALLQRFFRFCYRREWIAVDPTRNLGKIIIDKKPITILTLPEVHRLVRGVERHDRTLIPYLALRLFAGIRNAEAVDITWMHVKPRFIEVRSEMAKTRSQRLVTVTDSVKAWLAVGGELPAKDGQARISKVGAMVGVSVPQNTLRHSFVSYGMPVLGAARTAAEAGNSERMLFEHYRALVTNEEAEAFWNLRPLVSSLPSHLRHLGVESDIAAA